MMIAAAAQEETATDAAFEPLVRETLVALHTLPASTNPFTPKRPKLWLSKSRYGSQDAFKDPRLVSGVSRHATESARELGRPRDMLTTSAMRFNERGGSAECGWAYGADGRYAATRS